MMRREEPIVLPPEVVAQLTNVNLAYNVTDNISGHVISVVVRPAQLLDGSIVLQPYKVVDVPMTGVRLPHCCPFC